SESSTVTSDPAVTVPGSSSTTTRERWNDGDTGELVCRYAIHASRSTRPESRGSVPSVNTRKLSPPVARNANDATRYSASGSIGSPLIVTDETLSPGVAFGSAVEAVHDTLSERPRARYGRVGRSPSSSVCHCCSSISTTCAPVRVTVHRLLTNGRTALASA